MRNDFVCTNVAARLSDQSSSQCERSFCQEQPCLCSCIYHLTTHGTLRQTSSVRARPRTPNLAFWFTSDDTGKCSRFFCLSAHTSDFAAMNQACGDQREKLSKIPYDTADETPSPKRMRSTLPDEVEDSQKAIASSSQYSWIKWLSISHALSAHRLLQFPRGWLALSNRRILLALSLQRNVCARSQRRRNPQKSQRSKRVFVFMQWLTESGRLENRVWQLFPITHLQDMQFSRCLYFALDISCDLTRQSVVFYAKALATYAV